MVRSRTRSTTTKGGIAVIAVLFVLGCTASAGDGTGTTEVSPTNSWFASILTQLEEAWADRDRERMASLLALPRDGASPFQLERFRIFDDLHTGLEIEETGWEKRGFEIAKDPKREPVGRWLDFGMDEQLKIRMTMRPSGENIATILAQGTSGSRSALVLVTEIKDLLVDGSKIASTAPRSLRFDRNLTIRREEAFHVELPPLEPPDPNVMVRELSFEGYLLLAGFEWNGKAVGIGRFTVDPLAVTMFPKGFRAVRKDPVRVIEAVAPAPARRPGHLLVASWFLARDGQPRDKEKALGMLIEILRSGAPAVESTARTCLRMVTGNGPQRDDRAGWLRWWSVRQR